MVSELPPDRFGSAIADYHAKLLAFVRRKVGDHDLAYDLTADAEEHALRAGMPVGSTQAGFEAWLLRIARNRVIDYWRERKRRPLQLSLDTSSIQPQLIWAHDGVDDQAMVRSGLAALAPRDRQHIERFLAGYAPGELAQELGIQPAAERAARRQAFRRLRAQLEAHEPIHHTAYGESFGFGTLLDGVLATVFERKAGVQVNVIAKPASATESFSMMRHAFHARDSRIAIYTMDVVWHDAFAPHLVNLDRDFTIDSNAYAANVLQPNHKGHHSMLPLHKDFGMLYYRADLLRHYGYTAPPATWQELEAMAQTILAGEHARGNRTLAGYVYQFARYEGLVCHLLELLASQGGGTIIENGKVTLNNPAAIRAIERARRWVGTIAPAEVLTSTEEDTRRIFQRGDAIFMRNWPYAYRMLKAEPTLADRFAVAPLPHAPGLPSVATIGGSQLGVSRYAGDLDSALAFVEHMTSPQAQKLRALVGSYIPTLTSVQCDPAVLRAIPYLPAFDNVQLIARPSAQIGSLYNRVSAVIFQQIHQIMRGADAATTVADLASNLQRMIARERP